MPDLKAALKTIRAVTIFRAGTWNGHTYSEADLDAIVSASRAVGFTPPIKLGHQGSGDDSRPAIGWVENLRRTGSSLAADLVGLSPEVYELIRLRRYDALSAEIYWDLERNGKKYPRVLRALALLGVEVPAVDLPSLQSYLPEGERLPVGAFAAHHTVAGLGTGRARRVDIKTATATTKPLTEEEKRLKWRTAAFMGYLHRFYPNNWQLGARRYVELYDSIEGNTPTPPGPAGVRQRVDQAIRAYCVQHGLDEVEDYQAAKRAVFDADPKLKAAYAAS